MVSKVNNGIFISGIPEYNATGKLALFMVRASSVCPQPNIEASNKTKTKIFFIYKYLLFNGYMGSPVFKGVCLSKLLVNCDFITIFLSLLQKCLLHWFGCLLHRCRWHSCSDLPQPYHSATARCAAICR